MSSASIFVSSNTSAFPAASEAASATARASTGGADFEREPLERPVAASLHVRGHVGQRNDRPDLLTFADELERRDVPLDAVVIRGQRRGAHELDRAVLADETSARHRGCGHDADRHHRHGTSHTDPSPHAGPLVCALLAVGRREQSEPVPRMRKERSGRKAARPVRSRSAGAGAARARAACRGSRARR